MDKDSYKVRADGPRLFFVGHQFIVEELEAAIVALAVDVVSDNGLEDQ